MAALPYKRRVVKYGCARQPLFPSIPIDHAVPDILHLFLRISDVLINLLILELRRLDGIEKVKMHELDRGSATNVSTYEWFINTNCKICFAWFIGKDSKTLEWRDLTGPVKLKLFGRIDIPKLFLAVPQAENIQKLWDSFIDIYSTLRATSPFCNEEIMNFEAHVQTWITLFLSIYQSKNVTPYMRILVYHVPEFLHKYGTLSLFTQQGIETCQYCKSAVCSVWI